MGGLEYLEINIIITTIITPEIPLTFVSFGPHKEDREVDLMKYILEKAVSYTDSHLPRIQKHEHFGPLATCHNRHTDGAKGPGRGRGGAGLSASDSRHSVKRHPVVVLLISASFFRSAL